MAVVLIVVVVVVLVVLVVLLVLLVLVVVVVVLVVLALLVVPVTVFDGSLGCACSFDCCGDYAACACCCCRGCAHHAGCGGCRRGGVVVVRAQHYLSLSLSLNGLKLCKPSPVQDSFLKEPRARGSRVCGAGQHACSDF